MSVPTRSQKLAQAAFRCIANRNGGKPAEDYTRSAKRFPALIHTCGLAQAVAFALAKKEMDYIADLTRVLEAAGHSEITERHPLDYHARTQPLGGYLRLSRDALSAAGWLKRYVEAAEPDDAVEGQV
jgi:CRISPR-associated protein Cmr5